MKVPLSRVIRGDDRAYDGRDLDVIAPTKESALRVYLRAIVKDVLSKNKSSPVNIIYSPAGHNEIESRVEWSRKASLGRMLLTVESLPKAIIRRNDILPSWCLIWERCYDSTAFSRCVGSQAEVFE